MWQTHILCDRQSTCLTGRWLHPSRSSMRPEVDDIQQLMQFRTQTRGDMRIAVNFTLHCLDKSNTPPEIFKHRFYELCHEFKNYYHIFTVGSKEGNRVAAAVVHRDNTSTKCVRLPDTAVIFRAELYALLLAINVVRRSKKKEFCNLFWFHVKSAIYQRL